MKLSALFPKSKFRKNVVFQMQIALDENYAKRIN